VNPCPRCGEQNAENARFCSNCGNPLGDRDQVREARKTVTVMFMDAVGSTGMGEHADPESMRRVMTRYFSEIQSIVERHGGTVEKYIGDAVMAVFGVPTVHEDDALRAVRTASEIGRRLSEIDDEMRRERGLSVQWRTGINTGEVVAGDAGSGQRFVTGDAVNVAARLEQAAKPGEVLMGSETYGLVRDEVRASPAPALRAKGKSQDLHPYRLLGVAASTSDQPRRLDSPMIGRQRPRRLLADAYDQVVSEHVCHLFTVIGAAGVGKSRLVREFLADLGDGALVLRGRCLSYGDGITYWPIAEVVRQAAGLTEADDDAAIAAKIGALMADERDRSKTIQRLGELLGRFEGAAGKEETFWAVRTLLESLARRKPVVLVLDDLHWAEPTLIDLVEHLAEWLHDAPLLLICLARQELLEARPTWGGGMPYATTLTLEPLSEGESGELVAGLLGRAKLGAPLQQRIAAAAEGNPLFVEEMIGMMIENGQLVAEESGWSIGGDLGEVAVPPTIQALLAARLDGLPQPERAVLERASIEGKVFHRGAVIELAPDALRESVPIQLRSLSRKELVRQDPPDFAGDEAFRFRHLLIRDAAYGGLPKETRADLHARFAGWLTDMAGDHVAEYEEILAYHYAQAFRYRTELAPPDFEARRLGQLAGTHLTAAGQRALDRGDVNAARKLLGDAVDLLPAGDPLLTRVRADLSMALSLSGELHAADEMLAETVELAGAAGDEAGQAYAELARLDLAGSLGTAKMEELVARCSELLATLEKHGDRRGTDKATFDLARYQFFAGHAKMAEGILVPAIGRQSSTSAAAIFSVWLAPILLWGPTPVVEAEPRVSELVSNAPNRNVEGMALACLGMLRAFVGAFDEGREHIDRAIAIRREVGLRITALAQSGNFLGLLEILTENHDRAEQVLMESFTGLNEAGERGFASTVAGHLANLYVIMGRFADAEHYAVITRDLATADDIDAQARGLKAEARVLAARGDVEAGLRLARQAVAITEPTDYLELRGETYADLAEVLLAAGDRAASSEAFSQAIRFFTAKGALVQASRTTRRLAEVGAQSTNSN
jgi:predicted ATPase/class 3 adenylate cyclase